MTALHTDNVEGNLVGVKRRVKTREGVTPEGVAMGSRIRSRRVELFGERSLSTFARSMRLGKDELSRIENGERVPGNVPYEKAVRLARELGLSVEWMLYERGPKEPGGADLPLDPRLVQWVGSGRFNADAARLVERARAGRGGTSNMTDGELERALLLAEQHQAGFAPQLEIVVGPRDPGGPKRRTRPRPES